MDVPDDVIDRLRVICRGLPETYEEQAWVGTRWRVRKRTFVHVVTVTPEWPPAYARAAPPGGPHVVMTFRSAGPELEMLSRAGHPFFKPPWAANVVGMVLEDDVDWSEVRELLTESYCVLAPKKLVAQVDRPE